jgi:hypothetical protein
MVEYFMWGPRKVQRDGHHSEMMGLFPWRIGVVGSAVEFYQADIEVECSRLPLLGMF